MTVDVNICSSQRVLSTPLGKLLAATYAEMLHIFHEMSTPVCNNV